ncbi:MAG: FtsW/RodA/SpoVE family cell cycle protein [Muribaculaceae bacterium]|nr:FtsW/RodA/SpoVE family cell cycle protein [Muribaculaceae bacterium]
MNDTALDIKNTEARTPENNSSAPVAVAKADKHIWGIYICLLLISLVELYSASSREVIAHSSFGVLGPVVRHAMMLGIGLIIVITLQKVHYKWFIPATYIFVFVSICMMIYVLFFGDIINGARRSFTLVFFQIQPAEFMKLSAVLLVSLIMAKSQMKKDIGVTNKGMWASAIAILIFGGLLIKNGMTNTILLMAVSLSMMLIGGVKFWRILTVILIYAVCGLLFVMALSKGKDEENNLSATTPIEQVTAEQKDETNRLGTWLGRLERYFDGDETPKFQQDITAENRQEMYAYMAQANGGVIGVFPGNSRETARLPLAFSDFIYSIIIEDLGFIGGLFILVLYLWLLGRASAVASRCSRAYPALLVIGMAVMIVFQAIVHMAIVTGAMPVSGQPLPLISKGGSSILVTSIAFGIMLSVSRFATNQSSKKREIKLEIDALPEDMRGENPTQL